MRTNFLVLSENVFSPILSKAIPICKAILFLFWFLRNIAFLYYDMVVFYIEFSENVLIVLK